MPVKARVWVLFAVSRVTLNVTTQHKSHKRGGDNY